jgi:hypothetical protein
MAFTKLTKPVWTTCQQMLNLSTKSNKDPITVETTAEMASEVTAAPEETHTEEDVETHEEATTIPEMATIPATATPAWGTPTATKTNKHQHQTQLGASSAKQLAITKTTAASASRPTNHVLPQVEKPIGQNQK